jgi:signal transduction histidine kinase
MSAAAEQLEALSLFSDRFSHALRTPLGVGLGLVEDLLRGFSFSEQELLDAKNSLKQIHSTLEELREFIGRVDFQPRTVDLQQFFIQELQAYHPGLKHSAAAFSLIGTFNGDPSLLGRAARLCIKYILRKSPMHAPSGTDVAISTVRETSASELRQDLCLVFSSAPLTEVEESSPAFAIVRRDQSVQALGLLFAEQILRLHGGSLSILEGLGGGLAVKLRLPQEP